MSMTSIELNDSEKAILDDGQGWWLPSDCVELIYDYGSDYVDLAVWRDPSVEDHPDENRIDNQGGWRKHGGRLVYNFNSWVKFEDLPEAISKRIPDELATEGD